MFLPVAPSSTPFSPLALTPQPPPEPTAGQARAMLADAPDDADTWLLLGVVMDRARDRAAARACHRRAAIIARDQDVPWCNLGFSLTHSGLHAEALANNRRAIALAPEIARHSVNAAVTLYRSGAFDLCLDALERAIRLTPEDRALPWIRGQIRLHRGDYANGFVDYESRYWLGEYNYRLHNGPRWDGGPLTGKIILVTVEQGFGDTLMMARYLPMLKERGAKRVVAECQDELRRLLTPLAGVDALVPQNLSPPPIYHAHSSIMSLAHRFATTVDQVPPPVSLTIPEEARVKAAALLGPKAGRLRVGLVWTGNDAFGDNAFRATSLDRFMPILDIPGIDLFSLQKGPAEAALDGLPIGASITALGPHLDDFADTAAVVEQLDLVVMTDSSVAHLAGSLGVPVWNLVQHVPYWVYGMTGDRTPWYPSMRLYRQGPEEDWGPVFDAMLRDLRALAETHATA